MPELLEERRTVNEAAQRPRVPMRKAPRIVDHAPIKRIYAQHRAHYGERAGGSAIHFHIGQVEFLVEVLTDTSHVGPPESATREGHRWARVRVSLLGFLVIVIFVPSVAPVVYGAVHSGK